MTADEANSVRIGAEQMREIQAFADRDNREGMFAIVASETTVKSLKLQAMSLL